MFTRVSPNRIATRSFPFFHSFLFYFSFVFISSLFLPPCFLSNHSTTANQPLLLPLLRKEVIQPHLPIRLPCYDFTPVIRPAFGCSLFRWVTDFGHFRLPWCDGRCVQDPGTYSPQHSDLRLLAIPASCSRVADYNPNWDVIFVLCLRSPSRFTLFTPL